VGAVALAIGGILFAVLALVVLLRMGRGGSVQVHLGSDTFDVGRAEHMAERIASDGPFLLPDLSGGSRDLYLNHLGGPADAGWVAFAARPDGATRDCYVEWRADRREFVDTCTGQAYPPDGTGLVQFPVVVTNGEVVVDINRTAEREAQRNPATTSSVVESGIPRSATTTTPPPTTTPAPTTPPATAAPATTSG
jgi:hypothetical protein